MGDKHVLNGVSLVKALTVDVDQVSKFSFSFCQIKFDRWEQKSSKTVDWKTDILYSILSRQMWINLLRQLMFLVHSNTICIHVIIHNKTQIDTIKTIVTNDHVM